MVIVTTQLGQRKLSQVTIDTDLDMETHKILTDVIDEKALGAGVTIEDVKFEDKLYLLTRGNILSAANFLKVNSSNTRNSHDAEVSHTGDFVWTKLKTFTFTDGIKGSIRVHTEVKSLGGSRVEIGWYKNGVLISSTFWTDSTTYVAEAVNLDVDFIPGDTLELWGRNVFIADNETIFVRNYRVRYDNVASDVIVVPATNS